MEALIIFIAKASGLLLLFYCTYFFLLRKETFFNSNRWFLLGGLVVSITLPLFVFTKVVWVNPTPTKDVNATIFNTVSASSGENSFLNWENALILIYTAGFLALLIKFAIDFYKLNLVLKGKKIKQQADFKFIDTKENIAPFSYFEYIVYNSSMYSASELESILEHEKVHSDQNHTIDVLISRAFCILFWFNPIAWFYKKAITQNLEFIADREVAKKITDKKAYQYTLLKITTHTDCVAITNHFYQSLIKKRIVMLNKNQSKKRNSWKYYIVIPALAAFVLLFQIEVIAKERQQSVKETSGEIKSVDVYKIKKSSTDAQLKDIKDKLKSIHNIDFVASEIKRDANNQLTSIKIDVKNGTQQAQSVQTSGNETIKGFGIVITTDQNGSKKIGIQTSDSEITVDSENSKDPKKAKSKKLTAKTQTNVSTNSSTSTKTYSNTDANTSVIVTTNTTSDNESDVTTLSTDKNKIVISSSARSKGQAKQLVIVDGEEMPVTFDFDELNSQDIKTMHVYKGENATVKFGEKGKNGVIVIETRK